MPVPGMSPAVYFQMIARPTITHTTTSDMIVSWSIAYGKNGFPRSLTSSLYCWKTRRRSTTRGLATIASARARPRHADAAAVTPVAVERPEAGCRLRPRRRRDAEAHDEVQVQADQRRDRAGKQQHVDRVEPRQRVG